MEAVPDVEPCECEQIPMHQWVCTCECHRTPLTLASLKRGFAIAFGQPHLKSADKA